METERNRSAPRVRKFDAFAGVREGDADEDDRAVGLREGVDFGVSTISRVRDGGVDSGDASTVGEVGEGAAERVMNVSSNREATTCSRFRCDGAGATDTGTLACASSKEFGLEEDLARFTEENEDVEPCSEGRGRIGLAGRIVVSPSMGSGSASSEDFWLRNVAIEAVEIRLLRFRDSPISRSSVP